MDHFNLRLWLASLDPALLNGATFGLLALEGAGIPGVPGVVPMIAQVAAIDAGHTTLPAALFWGVLGNWLGSLLGYGAAMRSSGWLRRWLADHHTSKARTLLSRYGGPLIVVSRTVGSLRTPVTLVAGSTHYPFGTYVLFSFLGALLHVGVWQTLLWKFGPAFLPHLERWGREILLVALALGVLVFLLRWVYSRARPAQPD